MPSHATHLLFALQCLELEADQLQPASLQAINHGAQLPDMFYHNRRTRPSGLYLSVALHRRGFATMAARMLAQAESADEYRAALAFVSHGVLDRRLHPWINAFTGWYDPSSEASLAYRHQHALCERFLDVHFARRHGQPWLLGPGFAQAWGPPPMADLPAGEAIPGGPRLAARLQAIYPRCVDDPELGLRIANAWRDSRGYYTWTATLPEADYNADLAVAIETWRTIQDSKVPVEDDSPLRFAALVHPRLPGSATGTLPAVFLDKLLDRHTAWTDPCHAGQSFRFNIDDLWDQALAEMADLVARLGRAELRIKDPADIVAMFAGQGFHDGDLRSWQGEKGDCRLELCQPVDWFGLWFRYESNTSSSPGA